MWFYHSPDAVSSSRHVLVHHALLASKEAFWAGSPEGHPGCGGDGGQGSHKVPVGTECGQLRRGKPSPKGRDGAGAEGSPIWKEGSWKET